MWAFLVAFSFCAVSASPGTLSEFCVDDLKGWVTALQTPCPAGTTAFRGASVNLFDIFWGAWGTGGPNASLATSLAAVRDASASGYRFARTFASPWGYTDWGWFHPATRDAYWEAAAAVVTEAERANVKLIPSLSHGCPDTRLPCNPAKVLFNETYSEFPSKTRRRTNPL